MSSPSHVMQKDSHDQHDQYEGAVSHYLSPKRKDSVKTQWENPFSSRVIGEAIRSFCQSYSVKTLRVIDFGCGIGGGLILVQNALADMGLADSVEVTYLGLDNSVKMVDVAKEKWRTVKGVDFDVCDFSTGIPEQPADLYLSCGVPYSHLTEEQTRDTLGHIFQAIRQNKTPSMVVVDVLGRYSIEWVSQWDKRRWPYRMSFLADGDAQDDMMMSCYYAPELETLIREMAEQKQCHVSGVDFFDRSIMVGRHTSTCEYNPDIPPYRDIINSLNEPSRTTDFNLLRLVCPTTSAPDAVEAFFESFSKDWNRLVAIAADYCHVPLKTALAPHQSANESGPLVAELNQALAALPGDPTDRNYRANVVEPLLAEYLCRLEQQQQPGLGVGHTLIAIAHVTPSAD